MTRVASRLPGTPSAVALLLVAACWVLACTSDAPSDGAGPGAGGQAAGGSGGNGGGDGGGGAGGSGGSGGTGGTGPAITYHRDVQPILAARCARCHGPSRVGVTLSSYDDVVSHAEAVLTELEAGRMPPWPPATSCASLSGDRSLTAAEYATLTGWFALGLPEGDPASEPPAPEPEAGLSRVDLSLLMPAAHTPAVPEERRCFPIAWPRNTVTYVSGFRVNPGESRIVHHATAYLVSPASAADVQALDAADPAPGYRCPGEPSDGTVPWLGEWVAGGRGVDYPAGTGIKVLPGSLLLLQIHYATGAFVGAIPPEDRSSLDFKLDDFVDREAVILPLLNPGWLPARGDNLQIPAGEADVVHTYTADLSRSMGTISGGVIPSNQPWAIEMAGLHLKGLGTSARLEVARLDGFPGCLVDVPRWRERWQELYRLEARMVVQPGDPLTVTCHHDNSAANQPLDAEGVPLAPVDVSWGDGERDELCLGFVYATRQ